MNYRRNEDKLCYGPDYRVIDNYVLDVETVTPVSVEPVTLTEVKTWLEIDYDDKNSVLTRLITVARRQIEKELGKALAPQTIKVQLLNEKGNMSLPYWTSGGVIVEVTDHEGTVLTADEYTIENGVLQTSFNDVVYVEYSTGYTSCPEEYKQMILERIAYLDANRGDGSKTNNNAVWLA